MNNKTMSALASGTAVLIAAVIGARNGPQRPATAGWYALLRKPEYTPPGAFIGAAWTVLETLLAVTGYRLLRVRDSIPARAALGTWAMTLVGLAGFPYLFFRRKRLGSSTGVAGGMLASAAGLAFAARKVDPPSAAMTIPLLLWLGFATVLSEELWRRNPRLSRD